MEYLMTYGWAILLVLVMGASLWYLGIYNPGPSVPSVQGFPVLKPMLASCELGESLRLPEVDPGIPPKGVPLRISQWRRNAHKHIGREPNLGRRKMQQFFPSPPRLQRDF